MFCYYLCILFFLNIMAKKIQTYQDLKAWEEAMNLVEDVYKITKNLPQEELYGLKPMCSMSPRLPENLPLPGHGRKGSKEFMHHLSIAKGSLSELETQLILCVRLEYIHRDELTPIWTRSQTVSKLLSGLVRSLMNK